MANLGLWEAINIAYTKDLLLMDKYSITHWFLYTFKTIVVVGISTYYAALV